MHQHHTFEKAQARLQAFLEDVSHARRLHSSLDDAPSSQTGAGMVFLPWHRVLHVFALTCTDIGTREQGEDAEPDGDQHEPEPSRMGKKASEIAPAYDDEAKK